MPEPMKPGHVAAAAPGRFRRALGAVGTGVGLTLVFVGALVVSVLTHLDLGPTRRVARAVANDILGSMFKGSIVVGEIDRLSIHGIRVRSATAYDPSGNQVARLEGLRADTEVLDIGKSAVGPTLRVPVPIIHVDSADIVLDRGEGGAPGIADTFLLRKPGKPPPPGAKSPLVSLSRIEIDHVRAHGAIAPPTTIDAELSHFVGSVKVSDEGVAVDVEPLHIDARAPLPQPFAGDLTFNLRVPPTRPNVAPAPPRMEAGLKGKLGELALSLDASLQGQHVSAKLLVPRATREVIASFLPDRSTELPLYKPVSLTVTAEGDLPEITLEAKVDLDEAGKVDARGKLSLSPPPPTLALDFAITKLDPRVALDVPHASPLDASGKVKLSLGSPLAMEVDVSTKPLAIAHTPIPAVKARVSLDRGELRAEAAVDEPGAPTKVTAVIDQQKVIRFEVKTDARSLRAVPRIAAAGLDGSANVTIKGTIENGALDAKATGAVDDVKVGGASLAHAKIDAHVAGPFKALVLREAKVRGYGASAAGHDYDEVSVDASGPLGRGSMRVSTSLKGPDETVDAKAELPDSGARGARDIELVIQGSTGTVRGKVASITPGKRGLEIGKIALGGDVLAEMSGDLRIEGKELVGKLHGRDVDLAKVGRLAKLPVSIAGLANVDIDLRSSRQGERSGHIALEMVNGKALGISGVSTSVTAVFEGDRVRVDGLARLVERASKADKPAERCDGAIASLRVSDGESRLAGALLDPATWRRLSGEVTIAAEELNLRCLTRLVPAGVLPIDVRGKMTARTTIALAPGASLPHVKTFFARTRGLEIEGPDDFEGSSKGVDIELGGAFDPKTGATTARVALDDGAPIVTLDATTTFDADAFLAHPDRRAAMIERLPLSVHVNVPRRGVGAFASLPKIVSKNLPPLAGEIELDASLDGSLAAPRVEIKGKGFGLAHAYGVGQPAAEPGKPQKIIPDSPWAVPIDAHVDLSYDGKKLVSHDRVIHDEREIVKVDVDLDLAWADVLANRLRPKGRAEVKLDRVPLGDLPFLSDRAVSGNMTGAVTLAGIGEAPSFDSKLAIHGLKIGHDLAYDEASIVAKIDRRKDRNPLSASFTLASKTGGKFTAEALADVIWKDAMIPSIDEKRPANASLFADKFRIAALGPFVASVLSHVDGVLDGRARVESTGLDDDKAKISVNMSLKKGVFHVPQLGQELHNTELSLTGGAGGVVNLKGLKSEGTKGRLTGAGTVRFKGLGFAHADATLEIKPGEELPIALEGVPLGDVRGKVTINADKRDRDLAVVVGIPNFALALPPTTGRGVQALEPNADIFVVQETPPEKEIRPKNASRLGLTFNIGDIGIKGNLGVINIELDVGLSGVPGAPLKVEVADKSKVTGDIQLTRGRIVLLKRTFEIERGTVHMRPEDPGNPYLNVSARWDSPDGEIFIEYVGVLLPITKDKIKLRSPKLSESEIVATLLSGGAKSGGDVGGGTGQALVQQLLAQQLSTQIAGNVSTSLGTSEDGTFRPSLVYNSGDKVIELSTYGATGQQTAGGGAALKGQRTQITVDWRFWRNWSLRGRVDAGADQTTTGVDLLWQYRY